MTISRRARMVAPSVAIVLAAGSLAALTAAPASAVTSAFSQNTQIQVGDPGFPVTQFTDIAVPDSGQAAPYPSEINFPAHPGTITDVNVTVNVTTTALTDLELMLVSPTGQARLIQSDTGGGVYPQVTRTYTLDDEAPGPMPNTVPDDFFSYQPTNLAFGPDTFNPPAPASTGTSLSAFDGQNASGTWKLFVMDDSVGDSHTINFWTLSVGVTTVPYPSTISVNGLPTVTDVNVKLNGYSTTFSDDVDLLLVGPGGQQVTLMSDAGDGTDVTGLDFTFDDEASAVLPTRPSPPSSRAGPTSRRTTRGPTPSRSWARRRGTPRWRCSTA